MMYKCNHCKHTVKRDSTKAWLTSWCSTTDRTTRLWRVA